MLDLETLGTDSNSVILSIGAVKFGDGKILSRFYERVDPQSCVDVGLVMNAATVMWWMKQSDEARSEFEDVGSNIMDSLDLFTEWVGHDPCEVWGNGADFDNVILSNAYRQCGLATPWNSKYNMCYRTMKNLYPDIPMVREGTHHHAAHDAINQAYHLMLIMDQMNGVEHLCSK